MLQTNIKVCWSFRGRISIKAAIAGPDRWPDRQALVDVAEWATSSVCPTSLFLVLVCVPVTPYNEVTWWSVASAVGRERSAGRARDEVCFLPDSAPCWDCSACSPICAHSWAHTGLCLPSPPQASGYTVYLTRASKDLGCAVGTWEEVV